MESSTNWTGNRELQATIADVIRVAGKATRDALNEHALNVQTNAKKNLTTLRAVDTGRLRASIRITSFANGYARVVGTDVKYAPSVEFGSRPHFPPLAPIKEWCRRHGIPESAAYPIALKISKNGIPARPFLFPAFEQERPAFEATMRQLWRKNVQPELK